MTIIIHSLQALLAIQSVLAVLIISLLETFGFSDALDYRISIISIYNIIFVFLIIPQKLTALRMLSSFSLMGVLYITMLVVIETPSYIANQSDLSIPMARLSINLVDTVTLVMCAADCSRAINIVYSELKPRDFGRMYTVLMGTLTIVAVMYLLMGVCGLVSQGEETAKLVIDRATATGGPAKDDIAMVVGRFAMVVVLMVGFPMHLAPLKLTMQQFLSGPDFEPNTGRYLAVTFGSFVTSYILALLIPDVIVIFKFAGGILIVLVSCVLPNMIYWKIASKQKASLLTMVTASLSIIGLASVVKMMI